MAAWFTVYCARPVGHVTTTDILSEFGRRDFYTAAEGFGIEDEEVVKHAIDSLRVEAGDGAGGIRFRLTCGRPERRPILIHTFSDPEVIAEEREEAEELLGEAIGKGVASARNGLRRVVEVVAVQLGWSQLEDMGVVFAGAASEYLAVVGGGLIRDPYDSWWAMRGGTPVQIAGRG